MTTIRVYTREEVRALNEERARVAAEELAERRRLRAIAEAAAEAARLQAIQDEYARIDAFWIAEGRRYEEEDERRARERADAALIGPGRRALQLDD